MSGRGDKNKRGTSGQGSSNQSNQGFAGDGASQRKSNHSKVETGGKPSDPSPRTADPDAHRDLPMKERKAKNKR